MADEFKEEQPDLNDTDAVSAYVTKTLEKIKRGRPPVKKAEAVPEPKSEPKPVEEYVKEKEERRELKEEELVKDSTKIKQELSKDEEVTNFAILRLERKMELVEAYCNKLEEHAKFFFRHIQSIEQENKTLWLQSFNAMADSLSAPEASSRGRTIYAWWQDLKRSRDWNVTRTEEKLAYAEKVIDMLNLGNDAWELRNEEKIKPALDDIQEKVRKVFYPEYTL